MIEARQVQHLADHLVGEASLAGLKTDGFDRIDAHV
jgi:hypothetical protein